MITKNQVKYIQSLSQKKLRDEESVFVAEGPKIIIELLTMSHMQPVSIYGTPEWWQQHPAGKTAEWGFEVSEDELERISFLKAPNQVLGIFKKPELSIIAGGWQLLLDGIQDPGNLGTLIRIADWFGVQQVICSEDSADAFNPKVIQSSMASIGRVEVIYTNLVDFVRAHPHRHFYAAVLDGEPLREAKPQGASALVIGNESKGIRPELLQELTHFVTISRVGQAESLNAAVAAGIILSHLVV
ncbi:RNA methyltransferase [Flavihumibacter fluvii]|uniref:RNA methyltransferase n=1 Tax=Flavihumibacter fluvii TaxID=2838157 RepID=UPI001BDE801B|nr:RNA methyltransferase [Flavihumibacter fluvii]ULQ53578.1 RNA methyltransferase [Flavihumibacter fluvii]